MTLGILNRWLRFRPESPPDPDEVLQKAKLASNASNKAISKKLFRRLNDIKATGDRRQGIDFFRALYFLKHKQFSAVLQSLKEELRYFPENLEASELLANIESQHVPKVDDSDELLRVARSYSMVGEKRILSLYQLAKQTCERDLAGHFVECGVAAGGTSALLAGVITRYSRRDRLLYAFDNFEGMPEPGEWDLHNGQKANEQGWGEGTCAAPEASLLEATAELGSGDCVRPVKGLFKDTLPTYKEEIGSIALLHVDGDWYESTLNILENLFDQVLPGGVIQIDDYGYWQGCKKAVEEFAAKRGLDFELIPIDGTGVWMKKT